MKAYLIFSLFVVLMSTVFADDLAKLEDGPDKTVFIVSHLFSVNSNLL